MKYIVASLLALPLLASCDVREESYYTAEPVNPPAVVIHRPAPDYEGNVVRRSRVYRVRPDRRRAPVIINRSRPAHNVHGPMPRNVHGPVANNRVHGPAPIRIHREEEDARYGR